MHIRKRARLHVEATTRITDDDEFMQGVRMGFIEGAGYAVEEIDVDALAQEIRRVDGNHDMGAGALAEAIRDHLTGGDDE